MLHTYICGLQFVVNIKIPLLMSQEMTIHTYTITSICLVISTLTLIASVQLKKAQCLATLRQTN